MSVRDFLPHLEVGWPSVLLAMCVGVSVGSFFVWYIVWYIGQRGQRYLAVRNSRRRPLDCVWVVLLIPGWLLFAVGSIGWRLTSTLANVLFWGVLQSWSIRRHSAQPGAENRAARPPGAADIEPPIAYGEEREMPAPDIRDQPCYFIRLGQDESTWLVERLRCVHPYLAIKNEAGVIFPQTAVNLVSLILDTPFLVSQASVNVADEGQVVLKLPVDRVELKRRRTEARKLPERERVRKAYIRLCAPDRLVHDPKDVERQIERLHGVQDRLMRELTRTVRQLEDLREQAAQITTARRSARELDWIGTDLDRLFAMPVRHVSIDEQHQTLVVVTKMLYGEESIGVVLHYFKLGKFELRIPRDCSGIRLHNLTNRRGNLDTPNVTDGRGCLGNYLIAGLTHHIVRSQYSVVVKMLITYLTRDTRGGFAACGWEEVSPAEAQAAMAAWDKT